MLFAAVRGRLRRSPCLRRQLPECRRHRAAFARSEVPGAVVNAFCAIVNSAYDGITGMVDERRDSYFSRCELGPIRGMLARVVTSQ